MAERTLLNSPVPEVVAKLKIHDALQVTLSRQENVRLVLAMTHEGETAGSLTPLCLGALIRCLEEGRNFVAIVLSKAGAGMVRVELRPA